MHVNLAETVVIKDGNLFLLALRDSRLPAEPAPLGLFHRDCRHLSTHELRLSGELPLLLQASDALGDRARHELTNPVLPLAGGRELPPQSLSVRVERAVAGGRRLQERIELTSHHFEAVQLELELRLAADFAPMLALRGLVAAEHEPVEPTLDGTRLVFGARGRDGIDRSTAVTLSREPDAADGGLLRFALDIPAGGRAELALEVAVAENGVAAGATGTRPRPSRRRTAITTDDELFNRVLARSLGDLELLHSEVDGHSYYAAGLPWFATLFGRDSLITATETLSFVPGIAEDTIRALGSMLGSRDDAARDEQPGKVLHELRVGELANIGATPFARYYGSVDATPLWLCLLCDHADWAGSLELFRELRAQVDAALGWIEREQDADGLLSYECRAPGGLVNQGWKDSRDGVPDADGRPLATPVALVEVQGYVMRALRRVARLLEMDGDAVRASELRERAERTGRGLERMWLDDVGCYAVGLDGDGRAGSALASNQGHLLWAGVVSESHAARMRDVLMDERMFSGWGIRTLATGHPGYNPVGYHTGSVWPHDTAMIAHGLRRYGHDEDFTHIFEALLEAASQFNDYRLPELFAGYPRAPEESPVPYPVACAPQAWAAGAIPYLLKWGLGLRPDGLEGRLRIVRPSLPRWLERVVVSGLNVCGSEVDLHFERAGSHVTLTDARIRGDVELVLEIAGTKRPAGDL